MKISGQHVSIPKSLHTGSAGPKAPQPRETDRAARPHHPGHGKAHAKPHAQAHALESDRVTTHTQPTAPEPAPQPRRSAERLGHFNPGAAAPERPGTGEPTQAPTQERTAELIGHFRASGAKPGGPTGTGETHAHREHTTDIRRGPSRPGDLRSNNTERKPGQRGARSIRAFERNVHNALKEVRQGLRQSGLSGEELKSVRKQLNGLEKEFRTSLKETRQSLRGRHLGPLEAASAVNEAFQGLVSGIESLTAGQTAGSSGVTSGSKTSQQFIGKAGSSLQSEPGVAAPTGPAGTEETAGQVTDRAPTSTTEPVQGSESDVAPRPRPVQAALREGFSSLLSSLEGLSSSIQNAEHENPGPLTTIAVNTQTNEPSGGSSFQVQLAVSSYTEVNISISISGNGEELNLSA